MNPTKIPILFDNHLVRRPTCSRGFIVNAQANIHKQDLYTIHISISVPINQSGLSYPCQVIYARLAPLVLLQYSLKGAFEGLL